MKLIVLLVKLSAIGAAFVLGSCNTVQGVGQELESAGRAIEGSGERSY